MNKNTRIAREKRLADHQTSSTTAADVVATTRAPLFDCFRSVFDARNLKYTTSAALFVSGLSFGACAVIKIASVKSSIAVDFAPTVTYCMGAMSFWLASNLHAYNLFRVAVRACGSIAGTRLEALLKRMKVLLTINTLASWMNAALLIFVSLSSANEEQHEIIITINFAVGATSVVLTGLLAVYRTGLKIATELESLWISSNPPPRSGNTSLLLSSPAGSILSTPAASRHPLLITVIPSPVHTAARSPAAATNTTSADVDDPLPLDPLSFPASAAATATATATATSSIPRDVSIIMTTSTSRAITRRLSAQIGTKADEQTVARLRAHSKEIGASSCANALLFASMACWPMARQFAPYVVLVITSAASVVALSAFRLLWRPSTNPEKHQIGSLGGVGAGGSLVGSGRTPVRIPGARVSGASMGSNIAPM